LVVLFPGGGDAADAFEKHDFTRRLEESGLSRGLSLDWVAADTTLGHYLRGHFLGLAERDVVRPAQAAGRYRHTWLMGPSMGGFGSLFYAQNHPGEIDGVFAMAPFLGKGRIAAEIRKSGGLHAWRAPRREPTSEKNFEVQLWRWLHAVTLKQEPGPELFLGWGTRDSAGEDGALLAEALPKDHVFSAPGGHDWGPWNQLLEQMLAHPTFRASCSKPEQRDNP
jgi:pimeloyl-ACP methyl ester carboxylesterase